MPYPPVAEVDTTGCGTHAESVERVHSGEVALEPLPEGSELPEVWGGWQRLVISHSLREEGVGFPGLRECPL